MFFFSRASSLLWFLRTESHANTQKKYQEEEEEERMSDNDVDRRLMKTH